MKRGVDVEDFYKTLAELSVDDLKRLRGLGVINGNKCNTACFDKSGVCRVAPRSIPQHLWKEFWRVGDDFDPDVEREVRVDSTPVYRHDVEVLIRFFQPEGGFEHACEKLHIDYRAAAEKLGFA